MLPPTVDAFLAQLHSSNLLSAGQWVEFRPVLEQSPPASADGTPAVWSVESLGDDLVRRDWLTPWQRDMLLAGHQAFFLGKYKLLERIGSGGMGAVFKAQHATLRRVVALKILGASLVCNDRAVARFRQEMQAAAALDDLHIVAAYDAESVGQTHFLVMEYVPGKDLGALLHVVGRLPIGWACELVRQVSLGLQHAYEQGMVHRDIKPTNLLVSEDPETGLPLVKILDFGLARLVSEVVEDKGLTETGQVLGTPDYISPEQAADTRRADIRSDIFSLGCTLFRLLTGKVPFRGTNVMEKLMARANGDAPLLRQVRREAPAALEAVLAKMLAREPADRYQTPREVAAALSPFVTRFAASDLLNHTPGEAARTSPAPPVAVPAPDVDPGWQQFLQHLATRAEESANGGKAFAETIDLRLGTGRLNDAGEAAFSPQLLARGREWLRRGWQWIGRGLQRLRPLEPHLPWMAAVGSVATILLLVGWLATRDRGAVVVIEWPPEEREGARVEIDGQRHSVPAEGAIRFSVPEGRRHIRLFRAGYAPIDQQLNVSAASPAQLVPDWQRGSRTERQRELATLTRQAISATSRQAISATGGAESASGGLRGDLARFVADSPGTPEALEAARLMSQLNWPLDQLARDGISPYELRTAGFDLPGQAPRELVAVLGDSRLRQWNRIDSVSVSHDGKWIVSGSDDGTVRVFQPDTGEGTATIPVGGRPIVVRCSPTAPQVAIGAERGRVLLWDLRKQAIMAELTDARLPIAFSPDGRFLATGTQSRGVALWNATTGTRLRLWTLPPRFTLSDLVLDAAGQLLVAHAREHSLMVWETTSGDETRRIPRADHPMFSSDGKLLAASTSGGTVTLWQAGSGKVVRVLDDAGVPLGFRPDGAWLVTARHGRVIVWDLESGDELRTIVDVGGVATLSPNALFLASGDEHFGGLRFVDLTTGVVQHADGHPEAITCLSFTPDSATVVTGGADNALKLWEPRSGLERLVTGIGMASADFSPDGETLAIATDEGSIQLWDIETRRFSRTLNTEGKRILSLQFSPNGKLLAAVGDWGFFKITLRLWDAGSGRELTLVDEQPANLRGFAFSPDSRWMATAGSGRTVSLWNLATLRIHRQLEDHPDRVGALAFAPDSRHLAVACQNQALRFWNLVTGTATTWQSDVPDNLGAVAFSPDGEVLAASSVHQKIELWVVGTARQRQALLAPGRVIRTLSFSPDNRRLAAGNSSGQVHLWNWPVSGEGTRSPDQTLMLGPGGGLIRHLHFSPDSRHLLTINGNGTLYLLRLRMKDEG